MVRLLLLLLVTGWMYSEASISLSRTQSLRMAIVLFRHGDRSPISTYQTDPYRNYPWIGGFLALQPKGIAQMYDLGRSLRERYGFLLPEHGMYTRDSTLVLSSASERCVLTAQSLLAAFYEPPKDAIDIPIRWQPVTVNVLKPEDDILLGQRRSCPRLNQIRDELMVNPPPEFEQWLREGLVMKDYVSASIGLALPTMRHLFEICDALEVYHEHGFELPTWAGKIFPDQVSEFIRGYQLTFSGTEELKRIRGGAILKDLVAKLRASQNGTLSQSLLFYSGHDVTQTNLFNAMGVEQLLKGRPGYGATTVFELHETLGSDMEVRMVHYANTDQREPVSVDIPNCGKPCSLVNFERSVSGMLLEDYDRQCSRQ
uniref:Testicular acid phosphatase homolog n=2 Tax=Culex pipiens TaxID=7175 RepID=A0A8D8AXB9_CULPI